LIEWLAHIDRMVGSYMIKFCFKADVKIKIT